MFLKVAHELNARSKRTEQELGVYRQSVSQAAVRAGLEEPEVVGADGTVDEDQLRRWIDSVLSRQNQAVEQPSKRRRGGGRGAG